MRSLPGSKQKWPQLIQSLPFAYNCTTHETTGFAPFYLMFGMSTACQLKNSRVYSRMTLFVTIMSSLWWMTCTLLCFKLSIVAQRRRSDQYNKSAKDLPLSFGAQVLLAKKRCRVKHKLTGNKERVVYTVVASTPALHIYHIRDRDGNEHVVHRNLLF